MDALQRNYYLRLEASTWWPYSDGFASGALNASYDLAENLKTSSEWLQPNLLNTIFHLGSFSLNFISCNKTRKIIFKSFCTNTLIAILSSHSTCIYYNAGGILWLINITFFYCFEFSNGYNKFWDLPPPTKRPLIWN